MNIYAKSYDEKPAQHNFSYPAEQNLQFKESVYISNAKPLIA